MEENMNFGGGSNRRDNNEEETSDDNDKDDESEEDVENSIERTITDETKVIAGLKAKKVIINSGVSKSKRKDKSIVDKISATIILQSYLENLKK